MCAEWVGELELEAPQIGFGQLSYLLLFSFLCFVMVHDGRDEMIKVSLLQESNIVFSTTVPNVSGEALTSQVETE